MPIYGARAKVGKRLPHDLRRAIRFLLTVIRRLLWGWKGVIVRVEGVEFIVPHSSGSEFRRARHFGNHEPRFLECYAERAKESKVLYDVGAAIGTYTLLAAKLNSSAQVFAFEPAEINYRALMRNLGVNDVRNVTALKVALGQTRESANFVSPTKDVAGVGTHRVSVGSERLDGDAIELYSCDDLVADGVALPPDTIKIDVEGYELRVIRGMRQTLAEYRPVVLLEIHPELMRSNGDRPEEIDNFLRELGYVDSVVREPSRGDDRHRQVHKIYSPTRP